MNKHFPVRIDTSLNKPTHYVALCGYESDDKSEFVIPWSYKVEQLTCDGCRVKGEAEVGA